MTQEEQNMIVERFFEALAWLKESRQIRGVKTFTDRYGIHRRSLQRLQKNPGTNDFKAAWLTYLVTDFGISADWLLTGEGQMHD
jgi:hypothetical protein